MTDKADLTSIYNALSQIFHDSLTTSFQSNGAPEIISLVEKFFWTYTQNFDMQEAIDCIKDDFNLTLVESFIRSAIDNAFDDYLELKNLIDMKPFFDIFLQKLIETNSLSEAFDCLNLNDLNSDMESLILNKIKEFLREYYPTAYVLIENELSLSNLKNILFNTTRLSDLSVILQSFCEMYAVDPVAALGNLLEKLTSLFELDLLDQMKLFFSNYSPTIYSMIKDLNDLKSVSDVLFQIGNHLLIEKITSNGMTSLLNIYSNFTNAFFVNMDLMEGLVAIHDDLIAFVETQLVVCLKTAIQDYSSSLYELIKDETDLGYIIEMLSPVVDIFMQIKFTDLGLSELHVILKKFYNVFSETLDLDYSVDCVLPDLEQLVQNRTLNYLKLFFNMFSPSVFALVKDLDLDAIKNNTELILITFLKEILNETDSSLNGIYLKFIEVYERSQCFEDAWLAVVNDFFIKMSKIIETQTEALVECFSKNFQTIVDLFKKFNFFYFIERFFTTFCIETLKNYFMVSV